MKLYALMCVGLLGCTAQVETTGTSTQHDETGAMAACQAQAGTVAPYDCVAIANCVGTGGAAVGWLTPAGGNMAWAWVYTGPMAGSVLEAANAQAAYLCADPATYGALVPPIFVAGSW